jgi:uncharacterized membrane protein
VTYQSVHVPDSKRESILVLQRRVLNFSQHWLGWFNLIWGVINGLPWLAPVLMKLGAVGPARVLYAVYSLLCHQFANRSFFLFGPQVMYDYDELLVSVPLVNTWSGLRAFTGSPEWGYKVAWSDRMVALYGGIFLGGLLFALLRRRIKPPHWGWLLLAVLPLAVDGVTHTFSDWVGLGQGFRYHNAWLAGLTGYRFPAPFYIGNKLGTFNSWARLISGLLAGLGMVWVAYPLIEDYFRDVRRVLTARLEHHQGDGA